MTTERIVIRKNSYFDSVALMLASQRASMSRGVELASAVQATPLNVGLLEVQGFSLPPDIGPNDLVIALRTRDDEALETALEQVSVVLTSRVPQSEPRGERVFRSWRGLKRARPGSSIAIVTVPGRHAAAESAAALSADLDVFCFSDGVPVEHEVALKKWAVAKNLLLMGPDCGTAIIGGVGLGFANRVVPGPVGVVGASGTGTQEVCALLDMAGVGISHAVGVGSRDLGSTVGGLMTFHALDCLAADDTTEVILVVSKPPDPTVAARLSERAGELGKPVVMATLGRHQETSDGSSGSIEGAVAEVCRLLDRAPARTHDPDVPAVSGFIRGLFCGGTLCSQAQLVLFNGGVKVRSNVPLDPALALEDPWKSHGHTFVDLGEDTFTDGRLHPMIDPSLRNARVKQEARDPDVGLIFCDVVLGDGAHPDPAADLERHVTEARAARQDLEFIVALCGTSKDPQDIDRQTRVLEAAGAHVARSVESAARSLVRALERGS